MLPRELLRRLYKAELHCHLDGSIRVSTVIELALDQNVELPSYNETELRKKIAVGEDCKSLEEYLIAFDITLRVLQQTNAITRVMYEVCEDAKDDGVRYLEVRFSPILHMNKGLNLSQVMEAICEGQFLAERKLGIIVRIIVCGMRQMPASISTQLAGIAWRYRNKGVCGFDLAGPEHGFSAKIHRAAFSMIRHRCLNVTLHSGEGAGWESIEDSIQSCGVNRIGHGVKLIQNEKLLQVVANRRIAIEVCPTSNLQTKAVESLEAHPIRKFFDAGIIVVPCCDNWTVSNVTLSGEYELIQRQYGFDVAEILRLMDNGFASAFLEPSGRYFLRQDALRFNFRLLQESGYDIQPALRHIQFSQVIGPCVDSLTACNFLGRSPSGNWGSDPKITLDMIKKLPKADLHCTLIGSVSAKVVWEGLQQRNVSLIPFCGKNFDDYDSFLSFWNETSADSRKEFTQEALQTPELLKRGVKDVLQNSCDDGVVYVEVYLLIFTYFKKEFISFPSLLFDQLPIPAQAL
jgi:adenosine deaminase